MSSTYTKTLYRLSFLSSAGKELGELMSEVENAQRRHGLQRRTWRQDMDLTRAQRDAFRDLAEELDEELFELERAFDEAEDPAQEPRELSVEQQAQFLKEGRREIEELLLRHWGPPIRGRRKR